MFNKIDFFFFFSSNFLNEYDFFFIINTHLELISSENNTPSGNDNPQIWDLGSHSACRIRTTLA